MGSFYNKHYADLGGVRSRIAKDFGVRSGNILDIGTGAGHFAIEMARQLKRGLVTGIDEDRYSVAEAIRNARKEHLEGRCRFLRANFWEHPFRQKFDQITTFLAVVDDLAATQKQLESFCKRVHGLLKLDGTIVFAEGVPEDARTESQKTGFRMYQDLWYIFFSRRQISDALEKAGFAVEVSSYSTHSKKYDAKDIRPFFEEEVDYYTKCGLGKYFSVDGLVKKFLPSVKNNGFELDSIITVFFARKT